MSYIGIPPFGQTVRTVTTATATSGQTTFNISGGYVVGYVDVYLNGSLLGPSAYTATNGTTVVLSTGATAGDKFQALAYQPVSLADSLKASSNLSDVTNAATARSNLGITPAAVSDQPNTSTGYFDVPSGTTAQRPASPSTGMIRFNTTTNKLEQYDGSAWSDVGSGGAVTPSAVCDQANSSTGYFDLPAGTTAQRPSTPATGMIRYNTTNSEYELYDGSAWKALTTQTAGLYSIEYVVVAGGGGGGGGYGGPGGGGGGAGGLIDSSIASAVPGTNYSITIGAGGAGAPNSSGTRGTSGGNSVLGALATAIGGGAAANYNAGNASSGGSGGGGTYGSSWSNPGAGTAGQGNAGGDGSTAASSYGGGGGGGAGATGSAGSGSGGGAGGAGLNWKSLGTFYAGGGGGGAWSNPGSGGSGVGGAGGTSGVAGSNATANRGGGGGGGGGNAGAAGGSGSSGIVIIRYLGSQRGTGGTVTSSGGYTYHTFTTSGTYTA